MTPFELYYIKCEPLSQRHQLSTIFYSTIEEVFETLETADVDMTTVYSIIEPIVNRILATYFNTRMDQISVNTSTKIQVNIINKETLVNSINPNLIRYPGPHQIHT